MRCLPAKLRFTGVFGVRSSLFLSAIALTALLAGDPHSQAAAQVSPSDPQVQNPASPLPPPFGNEPDARDPMQRQRMAKMEKARQADRQKELVRDTEKLLTLAQELKAEVDKSNKDTLSIDVVKKAAEIEKLAKSVKDRMRG